MNEGDIYKRSVNLYKISDGEYKDTYVEMYLYMIKNFTYLNMYKSEEFVKSIFFGETKNKCIFEHDLIHNTIWFDEEVFQNFENLYKLESKKAISILQEFFMSNLNIDTLKKVSYPMVSTNSKYLHQIT